MTIGEIVTAAIAIFSVVLGLYGQMRTARLEDRLEQQREAKSREAKVAEIMARYREPLLRSAFDLQSRLFNIVEFDLLQRFYNKSEARKQYAIYSTLFVVAEYLGWVEILRREVQFLDVGDVAANRTLNQLIHTITDLFLRSRMSQPFRLFRAEQRAIGEIMLVPSPGEGTTWDCIGYATFVQKLSHPEFRQWFASLEADMDALVENPDDNERLALLQHALIDLIDFLDATYTRISADQRQKVKLRT
ncbi:hypothetical protein ACQ4M4_21155 [Leptolyngbya sp. AN02str]|uniref:hypothetical protein n=1 Tax=Leptolyngbya sp. AN02str TaxID=3423363 RepID=UPI003D323A03